MLEQVTAIAIAVILSFSPTIYPKSGEFANPETQDERTTRVSMIAEVDAEVAYADKLTPWRAKDDLALLLAVQRGESAFEYRVHQGVKTHIGTQDNMKSRCLGQIQRNGKTVKEWTALAGLDRAATTRCAKAMLSVFAYHARRCRLRKPHQWGHPLKLAEVGLLVKWYGFGHCWNHRALTKNMRFKKLNFMRIRRALDTGVVVNL